MSVCLSLSLASSSTKRTSNQTTHRWLCVCRSCHGRLYWFINAYCLSGAGITSEGVVSLRQFLELVEVSTSKLFGPKGASLRRHRQMNLVQTNGEVPASQLAAGHASSEEHASNDYHVSTRCRLVLSLPATDVCGWRDRSVQMWKELHINLITTQSAIPS